jgi:cytochrome c
VATWKCKTALNSLEIVLSLNQRVVSLNPTSLTTCFKSLARSPSIIPTPPSLVHSDSCQRNVLDFDCFRPTHAVATFIRVSAGLLFLCYSVPTNAADGESGKGLLERNCGRCHAVAAETLSPLKEAPNLWVVLRSFPTERLEFELAEGIGSRHKDMPQIQFSSEEIFKIESYLSGEQ